MWNGSDDLRQNEDIIDPAVSNAFHEIAKKSNFLRETIVSLSRVGLTRVLKNSRPLFSLASSHFSPLSPSRALVELSRSFDEISYTLFFNG